MIIFLLSIDKRRGERTNFEEDVRSRLTTFIIDDWLFEVIGNHSTM